ncbi:hypothetical protein BTA51_11335 [Hahella sp. CCB-MM4]|uniref:hypothetical protein n=1 Tax=Hahella sp. (strain CCB-MM4) TaxID=1926491 RepID=UPI000B9B3EB0|nr:hypothetical protein [Hahella sp. CCB-MM4]OZG73083.1 hypothetical protein BTA51_11335 [Hahella sp. CCB-MM4]
MEIISVWLIHHKASMDEYSPKNLDGSEYMVGIGVVPATNMREALDLFDRYLSDLKMEIMEVTKCEQYDPKNFVEPTEDNRDINEVAAEALESGRIFYACGISSEALDCLEDGEDD